MKVQKCRSTDSKNHLGIKGDSSSSFIYYGTVIVKKIFKESDINFSLIYFQKYWNGSLFFSIISERQYSNRLALAGSGKCRRSIINWVYDGQIYESHLAAVSLFEKRMQTMSPLYLLRQLRRMNNKHHYSNTVFQILIQDTILQISQCRI